MKLRERLKQGETVIGSWINTGSIVVAEIMAQAGFDFLVIDAEHSAIDMPLAQALLQAIRAGNPECFPMVRMPGNVYNETKRYLDAGAMGVIAPLIKTRTEAKRLVKAVKYPPNGDRGVGYGRSHDYGFAFDSYMATADVETLVCVQIEHIEAVRRIDDILAVSGVDVAFIGPYDLTASMGITAQFLHPDYVAAVAEIKSACDRHGVCPGVHVVQPDTAEVRGKIQQGFQFIAYSLDITMLGNTCRKGLDELRGHA